MSDIKLVEFELSGHKIDYLMSVNLTIELVVD